MKKFLFVLLSLPFLNGKGQMEVSLDSLMKHVYFLSSKECNGRLPGTDGYDRAIEYCQNKLISYGLKPTYKEFWPQIFYIEFNSIDSAHVELYLKKKRKIPLNPGSDFSVRGYSSPGTIKGQLVFCGYGLDLPEYSDYQNVDVREKIVMVFKSHPPFLSRPSNYSVREIAEKAYQKGAIGVIFLPSQHSFNPSDQPIGSVADGMGTMPPKLPQIQIHRNVAKLILNKDPFEIQKEIDHLKKPKSFYVRSKCYIHIKTTYDPRGISKNLVGIVPGNDPLLKDEYILITAHLDHVGFLGKNVYYPGANDNASGSAAVLEIARLILAEKNRLKRSVAFILFASEEKNLDGSRYFVEHMPFPPEKIRLVLNMDCIGHGDSIKVGNGESWPELWQQAYRIAQENHFPMTTTTWKGGGADLTPFHEKGIPGLYFVTTNSYTHLHLPTDKPETFNLSLYQKMVKLVYLLTKEWVF
ncbi:MAG: M20/M25/M40 family metallo-hydrolase [Bacteroidales bacterium]|nr:M20/M25/M40 family metallo-hydrolase [Bacteroidales bacterium]